MRYRALQELGFKEIPDTWVKRTEELTAEEKRRFIIADNVGFGEWDWDELANNWDTDDLNDWGLYAPAGFDTSGIDDDIPEADDSRIAHKDEITCPKCGFEFVK